MEKTWQSKIRDGFETSNKNCDSDEIIKKLLPSR